MHPALMDVGVVQRCLKIKVTRGDIPHTRTIPDVLCTLQQPRKEKKEMLVVDTKGKKNPQGSEG